MKALAIGGGRILAAGTESAVDGLKSSGTKIVDLQGRVLMPGFVDPHNHTILSAVIFELLNDVGYTKFPTRGKLIDELRTLAPRTPPGQWILVLQLRQSAAGRRPVAGGARRRSPPHHPIFVWYTNGHDACVNSLALQSRRASPRMLARCRAADTSGATPTASSTGSSTRRAR